MDGIEPDDKDAKLNLKVDENGDIIEPMSKKNSKEGKALNPIVIGGKTFMLGESREQDIELL